MEQNTSYKTHGDVQIGALSRERACQHDISMVTVLVLDGVVRRDR
jgi:hypothetical protein